MKIGALGIMMLIYMPNFCAHEVSAQAHDFSLLNLEDDIKAGEELELTHDISSMDVHTLLYQTGYLTIRKFDEKSQIYLLNFPNEEVRRSFLNYILPFFSKKSTIDDFLVVCKKNFRDNFRVKAPQIDYWGWG